MLEFPPKRLDVLLILTDFWIDEVDRMVYGERLVTFGQLSNFPRKTQRSSLEERRAGNFGSRIVAGFSRKSGSSFLESLDKTEEGNDNFI